MSDARCPRPDKRWFKTKGAAKLALRRQTGIARGTIHPYRCVCGGFHLGHKPFSRKNKLRAAA